MGDFGYDIKYPLMDENQLKYLLLQFVAGLALLQLICTGLFGSMSICKSWENLLWLCENIDIQRFWLAIMLGKIQDIKILRLVFTDHDTYSLNSRILKNMLGEFRSWSKNFNCGIFPGKIVVLG